MLGAYGFSSSGATAPPGVHPGPIGDPKVSPSSNLFFRSATLSASDSGSNPKVSRRYFCAFGDSFS